MTPAELAHIHAASFTLPRPWNAQEFATLLTSPHSLLVSRPSGFALARVIADEAELLTIAVSPAARRQGTGKALLQELLVTSAKRGAARIFLEVSAENDSAIALYEGQGFQVLARRKAYYEASDRKVDALVMAKPLGALKG